MKAKIIRSVLRRKFNAWADSIEDIPTREAVQQDGLITGGSIVSMLLGEPVNDYDIYFTTLETTQLVAEYYVKKYKENPPAKFKDKIKTIPISVRVDNDRVKIVVRSAGIAGNASQDNYQYFEQVPNPDAAGDYVDAAVEATDKHKEGEESDEKKSKYRPVFMSSNAITLSNDIQVVIRFWGSADKIHENYDFIHCTCSWSAAAGILTLPPKALEAMLAKDLRYMGGSKYPLCSIIHTRKFIARGWRINAGQYVKMCWDLNQLDLSDISVLEDQMVGVDAAYFTEVVALLRKRGDKEVDGTYLMEVIDRIF